MATNPETQRGFLRSLSRDLKIDFAKAERRRWAINLEERRGLTRKDFRQGVTENALKIKEEFLDEAPVIGAGKYTITLHGLYSENFGYLIEFAIDRPKKYTPEYYSPQQAATIRALDRTIREREDIQVCSACICPPNNLIRYLNVLTRFRSEPNEVTNENFRLPEDSSPENIDKIFEILRQKEGRKVIKQIVEEDGQKVEVKILVCDGEENFISVQEIRGAESKILTSETKPLKIEVPRPERFWLPLGFFHSFPEPIRPNFVTMFRNNETKTGRKVEDESQTQGLLSKPKANERARQKKEIELEMSPPSPSAPSIPPLPLILVENLPANREKQTTVEVSTHILATQSPILSIEKPAQNFAIVENHVVFPLKETKVVPWEEAMIEPKRVIAQEVGVKEETMEETMTVLLIEIPIISSATSISGSIENNLQPQIQVVEMELKTIKPQNLPPEVVEMAFAEEKTQPTSQEMEDEETQEDIEPNEQKEPWVFLVKNFKIDYSHISMYENRGQGENPMVVRKLVWVGKNDKNNAQPAIFEREPGEDQNQQLHRLLHFLRKVVKQVFGDDILWPRKITAARWDEEEAVETIEEIEYYLQLLNQGTYAQVFAFVS